jgi:hypothetical protein
MPVLSLVGDGLGEIGLRPPVVLVIGLDAYSRPVDRRLASSRDNRMISLHAETAPPGVASANAPGSPSPPGPRSTATRSRQAPLGLPQASQSKG